MRTMGFAAALLVGATMLPTAGYGVDDAEPTCLDMLKGVRIKAGSDYESVAAQLRGKGWHQTYTTTSNIASWRKRGHALSVMLNLGSGPNPTTTGAIRCGR